MKVIVLLKVPLLMLSAFATIALVPIPWPSTGGSRRRTPPIPLSSPAPSSWESTLADIIERVTPEVVSVYTLHAPPPGGAPSNPPGGSGVGSKPEQGMGSGIIVREDGIIVTNHHVIDGAADVKVVFWDRREVKARVVGQDSMTDIAVLRVDAGSLPTAVLGDSKKVRVGDAVLTIGNPLGIGLTVSRGILSAKGRSDLGLVDDEDFLQTDAAINPGNSGGPMLNLRGEVIGMNTAIASLTGGFQGIGFAIPSVMLREITEILISKGRVRRGELGVFLQDLTPALAKAFIKTSGGGVIITGLVDRGAAKEAGLRRRDIIMNLDGSPVASVAELRHRIAMRGGGARIKLEVWREGQLLSFTIRLKDRHEVPPAPAEEESSVANPEGWPSGLEGIRVSSVTVEMLRLGGIQDEEGGLIVTSIPTVGTFTGLKCGDVIVEVDRKAVHSMSELSEAFRKSTDPVLLRIRRPLESTYISVAK